MTISRHMSPYPQGDARHVVRPEERIAELKAATLDDVKRFTASSTARRTRSWRSSVTSTPTRSGSWRASCSGLKSPQAFADVRRPYQQIPAINQSFETPDKANATVTAGMRVRLTDQDRTIPRWCWPTT